MRAVVYRGAFDVELREVPDPRIEHPADAIGRITTTNICGSERHMYVAAAWDGCARAILVADTVKPTSAAVAEEGDDLGPPGDVAVAVYTGVPFVTNAVAARGRSSLPLPVRVLASVGSDRHT